jgi:glucose 1-dehydrogenase
MWGEAAMLAVGMLRGEKDVRTFDVPAPFIREPDEVLVRVKEVGLDGTDLNIVKYQLQDIEEGRDRIILGHEAVGVVEKIGERVRRLVPGDVVVVTVRRGCGQCQPCLRNQSDMCLTGLFTERGIHKLDGFLAQYAVDREQYMIKIPKKYARIAVLLEPLSIVEKGIQQIRIIQSRLPWLCEHKDHGFMSQQWGGCKVALVVGAGPLGLLATALIRMAGAQAYVVDVVPEHHLKVHLISDMGAKYIDGRDKSPEDIVKICCEAGGELNVIFEAAGSADTALRLIPFMSRGSIFVMTGIPRGDLEIKLDAAELVRQLVRFNQVIVGSVNSNRRHFEMALRHLGKINTRYHNMLEEMISRRFSLSEYQEAFAAPGPAHTKTVVEVEKWT